MSESLEKKPIKADDVRIGVYVCHCGSNIAKMVDVAKVAEACQGLPGVVVSKHYRFMCSDPGQELIRKDIEENKLNRVVVAACSPLMHESTFRKAVETAGLNRYFFEMANIREQVSWVTEDPKRRHEQSQSPCPSGRCQSSLPRSRWRCGGYRSNRR